MQHFYINPNVFNNIKSGKFEPIYFSFCSTWNKRCYDMRNQNKVQNGKELYGEDVFLVRLFNTGNDNESFIATVGHSFVNGKEMDGELRFEKQRFNKLTIYKIEEPKEKDCYGRT